MEIAVALVVLLSVVVAVDAASDRIGLPAPIILVAVGTCASFIPFIPQIELTPDLVLVGLLPPLLYAAALSTSLIDFRENQRPILLLSIGLVIFTTFGIGLLMWAVLPIGLAPALALGAVVAPPDAVAATSIARRVGMPRRLTTILEGESLVNDATAIVVLRATIAAIAGSISVWQIGLGFLVSAVGGVAIGFALAWVLVKVRRRISGDLSDVAVSLMTPWMAYLLAEACHIRGIGAPSGILAVVVAGLILGHQSPLIQSASSRLIERTNWPMISFILEGAVFLLIGLQVESILAGLAGSELSHGTIVVAGLVALAGVIGLRIIWVFPATYLSHMIPAVGRHQDRPTWQGVAVLSWAGMRGVVTLAAVFLLPAETPYREVLVAIALFVTAATLAIHGLTLPILVRRLELSGPSIREDDLEEAQIRQVVSDAGVAYLNSRPADAIDHDVRQRLLERAQERTNAVWERLGGSESPSAQYSRERAAMLKSERAELVRIRSLGTVDQTVLKRVLNALDLEESILDRLYVDEETAHREGELRSKRVGDCVHLSESHDVPVPLTPQGCAECLQDGTSWVHLRLCLECGHVGCCDSSPGQHASAHWGQTAHPVFRSFEPSEQWRWCFIDKITG